MPLKPTVILHEAKEITHPFTGRPILTGVCKGHSRLPDGHVIYTSHIVRRMSSNRVITRNTVYVLDSDPYSDC